MARIRIKGHGEIEVDNATAKQIDEMRSKPDENPGSTWIRAGKWSGQLSEVSGVFNIVDRNYEQITKEFQEKEEEYLRERKQILAQKPEDRAKQLGMFKLLYSAITGNFSEVPQDLLDKAEEIQLKYFTKYPTKLFCNQMLFREIIGEKPTKIIDKFSSQIFNIIGETIRTDKYLSKK